MKNFAFPKIYLKLIILLILYGIGIMILTTIKPNNTAGKIGAYFFLAIVPISCVLWKKRRILISVTILILIVIGFCFTIFEIEDFTQKHNDNNELINTQSYWYSSINHVNSDVLIHTLLRDKTAVIPNKQCWYYRFIEMFANQTEISSGMEEIRSKKTDAYFEVGAMRMRTLKDLFDNETYQILDDGVKKQQYQYLYIDLNGFMDAKKISVLSDNQYNLYMKVYE